MRKIVIFIISIIGNYNISFGQSIFKNTITDTNPSSNNPYTNGQLIDANITVSGIGRGSGLNGNTGNDRYNARDWNTTSLDVNDYFEFTITPKSGFIINFSNLAYKAQVSSIAGPINFAFRTSLDGFISNITTPSIANTGVEVTPTPIDLSDTAFQNINSSISFRFYAWGGTTTTGTFSINEFTFNGVVDCDLPTPITGTITQPDCTSATATIVLLNLPTSGTWDLYQNDIIIQSGGTGNTSTISGLNAGNYSFKIANQYCQSKSSTIANIINKTTIWDGTSWSNGNPSSNNHIIFEGNYDSSTDIESCSCEINSGTIQMHSNHNLKITNALKVNGGSLNFENNSSLIQLNDNAQNSGNISYKRLTSPISNLDYTYWSSPVTGFTIGALSPNTLSGKWYSYNASTDKWKQESASTIMSKGLGYIIRGPESNKAPNSPNTYLATFIGVPNNGIISVPIDGTNQFNLIGNPYPSAIDADAFLIENTNNLDGPIYFWTHNTAIQKSTNITNGTSGSGDYAYTSDDYASYNLTGGVAAVQTPMISGGSNTNIPNGNIVAGQGFFVASKSPGNAIFKNSMRLDDTHNTLDNSQFFKTHIQTKSIKNLDKSRIWLNLTNTQGAFKQTLIGYLPNASNAFETDFDGQTFNNNPFLDFYSIIDNKNLVIQGRAIPFDEKDEVILGYRSSISGNFTISIGQVDGIFKNKNIYMKDTLLNIITNLKEGPYSFYTEKGTFDNRFVLMYTNDYLLKKETETLSNKIIITTKNNFLKIKSSNEKLKVIRILNVLGNQLLQKDNLNTKEYSFMDYPNNNQILFIRITLENGQTIIKKVIY